MRSLPPVCLALAFLLAGPTPCFPAGTAPPRATPALERSNLDTTCAPCRDFYRFANGGWLRRTSIPAAYASWGSFDELQAANEVTLHTILESARGDHSAAAGSDDARLGLYYGTCMDSLAAEAAGLKPIEPLMLAVDGMRSKAEIAPQVAWLHAHGVPALFGFRAAQDPKRSERVIAFASQGGLGLPDRDFYTREDSTARALRVRYVAHVARSFELLGRPTASAGTEAEQVMALETALARASMTNVMRRDPHATFHKMPLDSLRALCPGLDWDAYLSPSAPPFDSLNVTQPGFFHALDSLVANVPLPVWQAYLRWKVADDAAPTLTRAFAEEDFSFQRLLTGAEALQPRWKRCLRWTDEDLGELLGRVYVRQHFTPEARERALRMVTRLETALGERIRALDWMGPETRARATEKLQSFANKIGYPDRWRDYAGVELQSGSLYANRLESRGWEARRNLAKIGRPVDRGEWNMTPPTVNAYYSSSLNSINFPAGILQPPFYDPSWDDAMNYGGIGAVIGHEMTHGFDDRGRQFDANGNLRDWWTPSDAERYRRRADLVAAQFDGFTVLDTLHVNGRLTLGENIADLGGIAVAYAALERELAGKPRPRPVDGFTAEQRFFLSWAQVWRNLDRDEALRTQVLTDPHSPPSWRVNGPFSNLPEFARAFGCHTGDAMVRPDSVRARIW